MTERAFAPGSSRAVEARVSCGGKPALAPCTTPYHRGMKRTLSLSLALLGALSAAGCVSKTTVVPAGSGSAARPSPRPRASSSPETPEQFAHAAGVSQTVRVQSVILPVGSLPYGNLVLPLLSPDGALAATQVGDPPLWETLLAAPGAAVPAAARIEIYAFDLRTDIEADMRQRPALVATVGGEGAEPVLLGRGADDEGFLVESPREDGSRWIGKASWKTGEIRWLVQDDNVNAFAALGPGGRLAWSRRTVNGAYFELVVRGPGSAASSAAGAGGEEGAGAADWFMAGARDWLFPIWANAGDRLFVFTIEAGQFDAHYGMATTQSAFAQSAARINISSGADTFIAYQSLSGQFGMNESLATTPNQIVFFHPGIARMVLWRPLAASGRRLMYLNEKSIAALVETGDYAMVATTTDLVRQSLRRAQERIDLVAGLQIPRPTTSESWPYLLLSPAENRVGVTALKLLPVR